MYVRVLAVSCRRDIPAGVRQRKSARLRAAAPRSPPRPLPRNSPCFFPATLLTHYTRKLTWSSSTSSETRSSEPSSSSSNLLAGPCSAPSIAFVYAQPLSERLGVTDVQDTAAAASPSSNRSCLASNSSSDEEEAVSLIPENETQRRSLSGPDGPSHDAPRLLTAGTIESVDSSPATSLSIHHNGTPLAIHEHGYRDA